MPAAALKHPPRSASSLVLVLVLVLVLAPCSRSGPAGDVDLEKLPPAASRPVSFKADLLPLFERSCLRCHGAERPRSGYRLDNRADALASGDLLEDYNGKLPPGAPKLANIIPGDSRNSPLVHYVARLPADEDLHMPPEGRADPFTAGEVALLRAWIDQGAAWDDAAAGPALAFSVTPGLRHIAVDGNVGMFREHTGLREGWGGGLTEFFIRDRVDPRTTLTAEGRVLGGDEDYGVRVTAERQDEGYVSAGFEQWRSYTDDTGWWYAPFGTTAPRLGEDFWIEHREAFFEAGVRRPDFPAVTVRYDYAERRGDHATTQWGGVTGPAGEVKNIFPNAARVDEERHAVTLNVAAEVWTVALENEARFEWWDHAATRRTVEQATAPLDYGRVIRSDQDHWQAANTVRLDRRLKDWLYVSGGYLYSHLEGGGFFSLESFLPSDPTLPPTLDASAGDLALSRDSHVFNANALLGPWKHLSFNAGVQGEWTRREAFAGGQQFTLPADFESNSDRAATEGHVGLRYTGLPHTVLWAEGRLLGETYDYFEEGLTDGATEFLRDSDADGFLGEARAGFTVSPWPAASLTASYRHRNRDWDFKHPRDFDLTWEGNGYPAFIRSRDTVTDSVDVRLTLRPLRWLRATLKWSLAASDHDTVTAGATNLFTFPDPTAYPGGAVRSATHDAQTVQAGFTLTPWSRLYLSPSHLFTTSRTRSALSGRPQLAPYEGDTHTAMLTATFVADEKTDLLATYLYSRADYAQGSAAGLPLGLDYTRHALTAGLKRSLRRNVSIALQYAFWDYAEPSRGGAADYTAHGFFATTTWRMP